MAEATLTDVIERLKAEGQLTRNTGTNSIKSVKVSLTSTLEKQTTILQNMLKVMTSQAQLQEKQDKLGKAGKDVGEVEPSKEKTEKVKKEQGETNNILLLAFKGLTGLGLSLAAIASSVGITAGLILGQVRAFQAFFPRTTAAISSSFANIVTSFTETFRNTISRLNTRITTVFSDFGNWIRGLLSTARTGINRLGIIGRLFTSAIMGIANSIRSIANVFTAVAKTIGTAVRTAAGISGRFSGILRLLRSFGSVVTSVARVVGRMFAPIVVVITAFDTIRGAIDGFTEGGILGGLQGAIDGFFTSLVTKPLDLVKDVVAWVVGKFGFDETSEVIRSFSFTELFTSLTGVIFDNIKSAITWVKTLFTDPVEALHQLWKTYVGSVNSIADLLFMPINAAVNWLRGKLGWSDEDAPEFSIRETIEKWVDDFIDWLKEAFSFLPSLDEVKEKLSSMLPKWMRPETREEQIERLSDRIQDAKSRRDDAPAETTWRNPFAKTQSDWDEEIVDLERQLQDLMSFRTGTRGFMDFGAGTPAMLHEVEAVVPRNTTAGEFLANNFTENWEPIMQRVSDIERYALQQSMAAPIIVTNAPTVAPVNNNIRGATNVSNQNISGVGMPDASGLGRFAN